MARIIFGKRFFDDLAVESLDHGVAQEGDSDDGAIATDVLRFKRIGFAVGQNRDRNGGSDTQNLRRRSRGGNSFLRLIGGD